MYRLLRASALQFDPGPLLGIEVISWAGSMLEAVITGKGDQQQRRGENKVINLK